MKTICLYDGPINIPSQQVFAEAGLLNVLRTDGRLHAGQLDRCDGRPWFACPDSRSFIHRLDREGTMLGFSTAPRATLARLDGQAFLVEGQWVRMVYPVRDPVMEAYRPRMVQFVAGPVRPQTDLRAETDFRTATAPGRAWLFFDPSLIEEDELPRGVSPRSVFTDIRQRRRLDRANVFFLPPVEVEANAVGYFAPPLRQLRGAVHRLRRSHFPPAREPLLLLAAGLADSPLLRDALAEGAALLWNGGVDSPSRITLRLFRGKNSRAITRYRSEILLPAKPFGPPWSGDVAEALRGDIEALVPSGLEIGESASPVSWDEPREHIYDPGAAEGNWQRLGELASRLDDAQARQELQQRLRLCRRANFSPDHDRAERRFLETVLRITWPDEAAFEAWRSAFFTHLFPEFLQSRPVAADRRLELLSQNGGFRLDAPAGENRVVRYIPRLSPEEIQEQILLAPVGTTFHADRTPRLNAAYLDAGYRLT